MQPARSSHPSLRWIALLEAVKGVIVLAAGFGLLGLLHRDVQHLALALVTRLHVRPDGHGAGIFLQAAAAVDDARLWTLAALAFAYAAVRAVEAYGLWRERAWGEWLGAVGGALYLPVELYELIVHPSFIKVLTLTVNVVVVGYLARSIRRGRLPAASA